MHALFHMVNHALDKQFADGDKFLSCILLKFSGDWGKGGKDFNAGKAGGKGSLPRATAVKPRLTEIELKLELGRISLITQCAVLSHSLSC